jgi:serine/threonine-protein kinase RsbW
VAVLEPLWPTLRWQARERFAARLAELPRLGTWARTSCERCASSSAWLDAIEVSVVEAASNIMLHGFGASSGGDACDIATAEGMPNAWPALIVVTLRCFDMWLSVDLLDRGRPPPDDLFSVDTPVFGFDPDDLANLPEAGMGVAIIRASVDLLEYRRRLGVNRLRMIKRRG